MALDQAALAKAGEAWRARQQQPGGLTAKQLNWLVDGYNFGYLDAHECKERFGDLIDTLERKKQNGEA